MLCINDPGFEGVETKSQHNNSKSSCTSNTLPFCSKEPIPLDDTPTVTPCLISSFNILPEGVGRISILPTPSGTILQELIKHGVTVGVSSRGMGSLEDRGGVMEVQDDFELLCWDFVSTPSNPGSYMHTLKEGKEMVNYDYTKVNHIVTEILCSKGTCPIV